MKIVFVVESLSKKGGAENALINQSILLSSKGHEITIIHLWGPNDFKEELKLNQIGFQDLALRKRWDILDGIKKLKKILIINQPDIINAINFFPMLYVALSNRRLAITSIVSYHNLGYETYPVKNIKHRIRKFIDQILNNSFDGYTAVSKAVASSYEKHLKLEEVKVIHNALPIDEIYEIVSQQKSLPLANKFKPNVIMVGRFVPEKGYQFAIEAIEILLKKGLEINLEIYGDGDLKDDILCLVNEKGLTNLVKIHKTVASKDLFKAVYQSDIFLLSSVSEGLPMAVAESMAIGTPVIATSVGGLPEMIEDGVSGILVSPKDPLLLSQQIERLINNKRLSQSLSENAKIRIYENFSPEKVIQELIDFYTYTKNTS